MKKEALLSLSGSERSDKRGSRPKKLLCRNSGGQGPILRTKEATAFRWGEGEGEDKNFGEKKKRNSRS